MFKNLGTESEKQEYACAHAVCVTLMKQCVYISLISISICNIMTVEVILLPVPLVSEKAVLTFGNITYITITF